MSSKAAAKFSKQLINRAKRKELYQNKEWYTIRSLLGNQWAFFYILCGARERGKSYSVMKYCLTQWKEKGKKFTWMKLNEASMKKMLQNNAAKFVDADLVRNFGLKLTVKGNTVFDDGKPMAELLALSTAANDKGVALVPGMICEPLAIAVDALYRLLPIMKNVPLAIVVLAIISSSVGIVSFSIYIFVSAG